jgi:CheY-like chemotaxis protein
MNKILVADDSSNERNGLCRLLEHAGYEVRSAADGLEALQKIEQDSFDLLLVDIWMPRMNGIELLAMLPEESRPKALVITGDESPEVLLLTLREKAYRFISKPIDPTQFLRVVKETLEAPENNDPIEVLSSDPNWVELRFPCAMQAAERIESVVDQLNLSLPPGVREAVKAAVHELLINAVKWGGHLGPEAQARMDYLRTRRFILCRIADPGTAFAPSDRKSSTETMRALAFDQFRAAMGSRAEGFGIRLAKSLVDELVFNEARNEVAMVKYLN